MARNKQTAAILLLILSISSISFAIHEDQDGLFDWHQQNIGRVKLAEFHTSGQRKRTIVATESNVLASLNLRTGNIVWRRHFGLNQPIEALHVSTKYATTLSSNGKFIRSWGVHDGVLAWETALPLNGGSSPAQPQLLPITSERASVSDYIVSSGGVVVKISGSNGDILWEKKFQASEFVISKGNLLALKYYESTRGISDVQFAYISLENGAQTNTVTASIPVPFADTQFSVTKDHLLALNTELQKLFAIPLQEEHLKLSELRIGDLKKSGTVKLHSAQIRGGICVVFKDSVALLKPVGEGVVKVVTEFDENSSLIDSLLLENGDYAFLIVSQKEENGKKVARFQVFNSEGTSEPEFEDSVVLPGHRGVFQKSYLNSYARKEGPKYGFRFLTVGQDDSLSLIQQSSVIWEREEALASIVKAKIIDLPLPSEGVTGVDIEHSLEEWFMKQWLTSKSLLHLANSTELENLHRLKIDNWSKNAPTKDHNGFRKLILAMTKPGKLFGLHSGNGRILYSSLLNSLQPSNPVVTNVRPRVLDFSVFRDSKSKISPEYVVLAETDDRSSGVLVTVDAISGTALSTTFVNVPISLSFRIPFSTPSGIVPYVLVSARGKIDSDPTARVFPESDDTIALLESVKRNIFFHTVEKAEGVITGYGLSQRIAASNEYTLACMEIWRVAFPATAERIATVASRKPNEHVHTQTRAKPDRSVEFKFLSKTLLFVATETPPSPTLSIDESYIVAYIIDSVSGRILHRVTHQRMKGPVHAVFSENWVVYHYFNLQFHRYEMSVIEMFDISEQFNASDIAKYALGFSGGRIGSLQSSWSHPKIDFQTQTYFFSYSVQTMAVTSTARGITPKQILLGLAGGQILALDKRLLDPRRSANPTQAEKEEGIMPYLDSLPVNPTAYLTHGVPVEGLRGIVTEPSGLESTTLVFAYGVDLFYMRTAPSRTFDTLSEDFSYVLLLGTIVALLVAIAVFYVLGERRDLKLKWK